MAWIYGVPNFIGLYTYYSDLLEPTANPSLGGLKRSLWASATNKAKMGANILSSEENLNKANEFLTKVAHNERAKEIRVIQAFCDKTQKTFPSLQKYLSNPKSIEKDLPGFYAQLTAAINKARQGTKTYLNELKRISKNLGDKTRTLENYKADDYRYRLSGDITSFLNRLTGNFNTRVEKTIQKDMSQHFSLKIQNLAMDILEKLGLRDKISSGENFSAIAASLLIQLESEVQQAVDKDILSGLRTNIDSEIDGVLKKIEKRYTDIANKKRLAQSPLDKALLDINSLEFQRITENAKKILNIQSDFSQDEKSLQKKIRSRETRLSKNRGVKYNQEIIKIREKVKKNQTLNKSLQYVKFNISGSQNSKHGSINELVVSLLNNGTNIKGQPATDVITFTLNGNVQVDHPILNQLVAEIGKNFAEAVDNQTPDQYDKEVRDTRQLMISMNDKVTQLIKDAEEQIRLQDNFNIDEIFIFHESLKLYSSAETERSKKPGFEGRKISIMSYIDDLYSMSSSTSFPLSREDIGFLALNLMPGAAAEDEKNSLEYYLSKYAGMVMFDDLTNMAEEAVAEVSQNENNLITQIHLYNLNGIYVPASMLLSFISDAVNTTTSMISSGYAAKATISVPKENETYSKYMRDRITSKELILDQNTWKAVAAENNLNTKVTITFLTAFKAFIEKLPKR